MALMLRPHVGEAARDAFVMFWLVVVMCVTLSEGVQCLGAVWCSVHAALGIEWRSECAGMGPWGEREGRIFSVSVR